MNGFLLLVPFLIIRFVLLSSLSRQAVGRAAHFAPVRGAGKAAYYIYQLSTAGIFLLPIFLKIAADFSWKFYLGLICYVCGLILCAAAIISFSAPDDRGMNSGGLYRFSRNPMYIAYFVCFAGVALLTQSLALFGTVLVFQVSAHWIILAEERWCIETFGSAYRQYMERVGRYFWRL